MKQKIFKSIIASIALTVSVFANATLITSSSDPSLVGATVETFTGFSNTNADFNLLGSFSIISGSNCQYAPPQSLGDNCGLTSNTITFDFFSEQSAVGLVIGAANNDFVISVFDSQDSLIENFTVIDQVSSLPYPYSGFYGFSGSGISKLVLEISDASVFDDLYYTARSSVPVPEPASLTILGLGLAGLAARRRIIKK